MSSCLKPSRIPAAVLVAALLAMAIPSVVSAQLQCAGWESGKTPAEPPPSNLWSGLEPAYTTLPSCQQANCTSRDSSWYNRGTTPHFGVPYWLSVEIQSGYAFLATNYGFQIWNLNGGNHAEAPERLIYRDIAQFAPILTAQGHEYFRVRDMAASDDGNLAAITGGYSLGMVIADTSSKTQPKVLYQDPGQQLPGEQVGRQGGRNVHVQTINGRTYGFLASEGDLTNLRGVWAYDMTRAKEINLTGGCIDHQPTNPNPTCSGVFKGRYSTLRATHVDGAGDDNNGHYLAASGGFHATGSHWGFRVWRVSNPSAPVQVLHGLDGKRVDGVALWQKGTKFFLALSNRGANGLGPHLGQIYDVTCIKTGTCGSLPSLLVYEFPLAGFATVSAEVDAMVQDSEDSGKNWVYFARRGNGGSGLQMEWLFDVTGISSTNPPLNLTGGDPQSGNLPQPTMTVGSPPLTVGYWSYMYFCHPSGTNYLNSYGGEVWGNRFYRAAESVFDIHRLQSVTPTITVTGPPTGYTGQSIQFSATASSCTPTAGGWNWTASGGGQVVGGGTTANPTIQWSTIGNKTVTATNSGCSGANQVAASINVLDPAPSIGTVIAAPVSAPVCTPITFTANNITGLPPLTTNWTIEQGGNPVPGEGGPGNPFVWDTEGVAPGTYQGRVTVSGPGGSTNKLSPLVTLSALDPLPSSPFAITNQPPLLGTVQFGSAAATGATEWRWDFDGGPDGPIAFDLVTTDPQVGPSPVHSYSTIGVKHVWLEVRNCTQATWVRSTRLDVDITEIQQLVINDFRAQCPFGVCSFEPGDTIIFFHDVEGDPTGYAYDWNGTGSFTAPTPSPVTTHAYTQEGSYKPVLRVTRGPESVTFQHVATITIDEGGGGPPPPPATITISGPTSLDLGEEAQFTATASNCTPSSNWSWNTGGGVGSSTTNQITLSWTSTGPKTISVSNSGCAGAIDSHTISVTEDGGGNPNPNDLGAEFTVEPANPDVGEEVTFDASASAGGPTGWVWDFGDGEAGSGEVVTHTFDEAGTYTVELTISKTAPGCGQFGQNLCVDSATASVVVGGGGPGGGDCVADANTLCLMDGRFQVRARFLHPQNGIQPAKVYEPFSADRTGMFWFFRPDNVELIAKSLDGTNPDIFPNPAYWFFYGGLSNVEYWIEVTDTANPSAEPVEYHNLPGVICGQADTGAFPTEDIPVPAQGGVVAGAPIGGAGLFEVEDRPGVITAGGSSGTCVPSLQRLCLLDGRFAVEVDWHDQHNNEDGVGQAITGTDRTGYFWFFRDDNIELVTKMIDATQDFDHFWILWGGLSDVEYTIKVIDTVTEQSQEYTNPPGSFCGGADTSAFPAD